MEKTAKIMKALWLVSLFFVLVIAAGCGGVKCDKPYIAVGEECCLDKDGNAICDKDETPLDDEAIATITREATEREVARITQDITKDQVEKATKEITGQVIAQETERITNEIKQDEIDRITQEQITKITEEKTKEALEEQR